MKYMLCLMTVLLLGGCATVLSGSTSTVHMRVVDVDDNSLLTDVKCSVSDNEGMVYLLNTNPGEVIVNKGKGVLRVDCKKSGYAQQNMGVAENINGVTFVNVLFWPGFIVDAVTGNIHKYPSNVVIQMKKQA